MLLIIINIQIILLVVLIIINTQIIFVLLVLIKEQQLFPRCCLHPPLFSLFAAGKYGMEGAGQRNGVKRKFSIRIILGKADN